MKRSYPCTENDLTVYQLEDVVVDEVRSSCVTRELEGLCVVHRALLLVDLQIVMWLADYSSL